MKNTPLNTTTLLFLFALNFGTLLSLQAQENLTSEKLAVSGYDVV